MPTPCNLSILTQLDDVVGEFLPFERLIVVDIDLPKQLDELLDELCLVTVLSTQVIKHDLEELVKRQTLKVTLAEVVLDLLELAIVQVAHDVFIVFVAADIV